MTMTFFLNWVQFDSTDTRSCTRPTSTTTGLPPPPEWVVGAWSQGCSQGRARPTSNRGCARPRSASTTVRHVARTSCMHGGVIWRALKSLSVSSSAVGWRVLPVRHRVAMCSSSTGDNRKRVLSIQSHVVHGYVGNKCAVFPLQLLGYEVDFINSVQFCCHTGYPRFGGGVLGGDELDALAEGLEANGLLTGPNGVYSHLLTGYIGSDTFLKSVLRLVAKLRKDAPDFRYVCDPVLGDNGQLYVPEALIDIYRREVLPAASVATPNQFEIETLTGVAVSDESDAVKACEAVHAMGPDVVVVTTLDYDRGEGWVGMMLSHRSTDTTRQYVVRVPLLQARFTGSGDLTSALLLAFMDQHADDLPLALEKTAAAVAAVLRTTQQQNVEKRYKADDGSVVVVPPELQLVGSKAHIERPPLADGPFRPVARLVGANQLLSHIALAPDLLDHPDRDDIVQQVQTSGRVLVFVSSGQDEITPDDPRFVPDLDTLLDTIPPDRCLLLLSTSPPPRDQNRPNLLTAAYGGTSDSRPADFRIASPADIARFSQPPPGKA